MKKLPEPTSLKDMQDQTWAVRVAELLAAGISQAEICRQLDKSPKWLYRLCDKYPEIIRGVHADVQKKAALLRPRVLDRLTEIMETSENHNAGVKAGLAINDFAGVSFVDRRGDVTVEIKGENVSVNMMTGRQMDELMRALAKDIGPESEKVIDAECSVRGVAGEGESGDGGREAGAPQESAGGPDKAEA